MNGSEGEVLIKLGNGSNRCFERYRREIFLNTCDETNAYQKFFALNGSFDGSRFEMSQKGFTSQCVTTAHHPKAGKYQLLILVMFLMNLDPQQVIIMVDVGEVVELHDCEASRSKNSETSYWNKY